MNNYPIKLGFIAMSAIWGGKKLAREYGKICDKEKISETWELSVRDKEKSVIINGEYLGMTLENYIKNCGFDAVGSAAAGAERFPLLIKFIDAEADLSVQVHPNDEYSARVEGDSGKTEMWYIVEAEEGAKLAYGLADGIDSLEFARLVKEEKISEAINYIPVKAGETYFIPAGMLHAIGAGILIAEIQQNADITYRVYDYGRLGNDGKPRELHVNKALDVTVPFAEDEINAIRFARGEGENDGVVTCLANSDFFKVDKIVLDKGREYALTVDKDSFRSLICVKGEGEIIFGSDSYYIAKGESYFLPAGLGEVTLRGECDIIASGI